MEKRKAGPEIKMLSNLIKRQVHALESAGHGYIVTGMQGHIMGYLCHNRDKEIFQRDIEAEFLIRRSTATGILQLMEKNGLIRRQPVARDARLKQIVLTERALTVHHAIEEKLDELEVQMRRKISDEEMEIFFSVVDRMKENLDD